MTRDVERELRYQGGDDLVDEIADELPDTPQDDQYPKPDEREILERKSWLEEFYRPLHEGTQPSHESHKFGGVSGLRALRYGQDTTPDKLYQRLSNDVRVRSMQSHKLIFQVRSLLGRNPMVVRVPAASGSQKAIDAAGIESRWGNQLAAAIERASLFSPIQESDDAQCEAFGGWEVYLTDKWKRIDFDQGEDEDDKDYDERITREKRSAGLPFGIRSLDSLSTLIDVTDDGAAIDAVLIVEKKRRRSYLRRASRRAAWRESDEYRTSGFAESGYGTSSGATECEVTRYWDPVWYAELLEGKFTICEKHGLPGIPVFPAWGFLTSARTMADKFQGVAFAVGFTEAISNDVMTQEVDSRLTYNRPKPIATADSSAPDASEEVIDLSGPELKLLPPGYTLDDAFAKFRSMALDPTIGMVLGLGENQSIAPVVGGQSPSADASGFSLNLLTSNAIGPYMPLLTNKATAWGKVVDFTRQIVKHTLKEPVELVVTGAGADADRVEWVALKPDDVTDIPAQVDIDPISDAERIALAKHFLEGVMGGFVPERILQERGYGADNVDFWREEIIQDAARRMLAQYETQQALREMIEEEQAASAPPPTILGANGMPLPPSTGDMQQAGGMPIEPQPSTVGRENVGSGGQAGMKPQGQGVSQAGMNGAGGF